MGVMTGSDQKPAAPGTPEPDAPAPHDQAPPAKPPAPKLPPEIGGPAGPEPTRFGDWERKGRVTDF
jgi:hypothetical protein